MMQAALPSPIPNDPQHELCSQEWSHHFGTLTLGAKSEDLLPQLSGTRFGISCKLQRMASIKSIIEWCRRSEIEEASIVNN